MGGCEASNVGEPLPQSLVKRAGNKWLRARHKVNATFQATNPNPIKVLEDLRHLPKSLLVRVYAGGL